MSEMQQPAPAGGGSGGNSRPWRALATVVAAFLLGIGVPALVQTLDFVKAGGFPLGFYLTAQGMPIVLAILLFGHARRANRLERERAGDRYDRG